MSDHSYVGLERYDDDVLLLEWDIAVDRSALLRFIRHSKATPDRVVVAPYMLHQETYRPVDIDPVWAHRRADKAHVSTGEPTCAFFGFGLAYLPAAAIRGFREAWPAEHFSDSAFSTWYIKTMSATTPIAWDVPVAHLHYSTAGLLA